MDSQFYKPIKAPATFVLISLMISLMTNGQVTTSLNCIIESDIRIPGTKNQGAVDLLSVDPNGRRISISYVDGFGRTTQNNEVQASPNKNDILSNVEFDQYGRQIQTFLPFVDNNINPGSFRSNWKTAQLNFYSGLLSNVDADVAPFQTQLFEQSPLDRILATGQFGATWQPNLSDPYDPSKHVIKKLYETNLTNEVRIFSLDGSGLPTSTSFYNESELNVSRTFDEHNNQIRTYVDKEGRAVLKRIYVDQDSLQTQYVYDDFGLLRFVIQPEGFAQLPTLGTATLDANFINKWVFAYVYDHRNRMIIKKIPGADLVTIFYDQWDRQVLTQDGNLRAQGKYLFTKYDAYNRAILTGLYSDSRPEANVRQDVAASANRFELVNSSAIEGYTENRCFPTTNIELLSASFYDSYLNLPGALAAFNFTPEYGVTVYNSQVDNLPVAKLDLVLGLPVMMMTKNFYDDRYRLIQSVSNNVVGGQDRVTNVYSWDGKIQQSVTTHTSSFFGSNPFIQKRDYTYDHADRLLKVTHQVLPFAAVILAENSYNEVGQLIKKKLHQSNGRPAPLQTLDYHYNIRGWLASINEPDKNSGSSYDQTDLFNLRLTYNTTLSGTPQFNGNIAEEFWKGGFDNDLHAYKFGYDGVNRLKTSNYASLKGGDPQATWNVQTRYDENIPSYDRNGNIKSLTRYAGPGQLVDQLNYQYNGNQLNQVDDQSGSTSTQGFVDKAGVDYAYDFNGNLVKDDNKGIQTITYNHLNLPSVITFPGKGTINFIYEAAGRKLAKITNDQVANLSTITKYDGAFEYKSRYPTSGTLPSVDTIENIFHDEGRLRFEKIDTTQPLSLANIKGIFYDYFLKDHLGNVRTVITTQTQSDFYVATVESTNRPKEDQLFTGLGASKPKPAGFEATGNNNYGTQSICLNGDVSNPNNKRLGASKVLRVMAGDTLSFGVHAWYQGSPTTPVRPGDFVGDILGQFAFGGGGALPFGVDKSGTFQIADLQNQMTALLGQSLNDRDQQQYASDRPKAFLNWVFVDDNFAPTKIPWHTSAQQVPVIPAGDTNRLMVGAFQMVVKKNGYFYIYLSNESPQDVFFDNLMIIHNRGPVLEETGYYPFGLMMTGINSKAINFGILENHKHYNGNELESKEFTDGSGLEVYDFEARSYDQQVGRFFQIDPEINNDHHNFTPYAFAYNNPATYCDPFGRDTLPSGKHIYDKGADQELAQIRKENPEGALLDVDLSERLYLLGEQLLMFALPEAKVLNAASGSEKSINNTEVVTEEVSTGLSNITKNAANGKKYGEVVEKELAASGHTSITPEITLEAANGAKTRVDFISFDQYGQIVLTEAKSSATAPLTQGQKAAHPSIASDGAVIVGNGKPPFVGGTKIPARPVNVVRPTIKKSS